MHSQAALLYGRERQHIPLSCRSGAKADIYSASLGPWSLGLTGQLLIP